MNREIKFRAWDKKSKEYYKGAIAVSNDGVIRMLDTTEYEIWADTSFIPEQYTGLKDKHGKELYEGDIVQYLKNPYTDLERAYMVIEYKGCMFTVPHEPEIIGNIYENPELLEGE